MPIFRPLRFDEIEVKVKKVTEKGAALLLYKTARTDMDILDETVGPDAWTNDYREIKGNLYCGIAIHTETGWIWKWDCGVESREDNEGNEKKGEASDAFKRAGFRWGIGREIYSAPNIFIQPDRVQIHGQNGKYRTYDIFSVEKIAYCGGKISGLALRNDTMGKRCFVWQRSN